eukprot:gb/GEZN01001431.1/.p1 GENE.gb/GEZN01001431.1/~~gb/GEZN01001431.1/.p1  ORF type:complete len:936 (-),score=116.80 gb/GEZN01001431.1/:216-3023(-)
MFSSRIGKGMTQTRTRKPVLQTYSSCLIHSSITQTSETTPCCGVTYKDRGRASWFGAQLSCQKRHLSDVLPSRPSLARRIPGRPQLNKEKLGFLNFKGMTEEQILHAVASPTEVPATMLVAAITHLGRIVIEKTKRSKNFEAKEIAMVSQHIRKDPRFMQVLSSLSRHLGSMLPGVASELLLGFQKLSVQKDNPKLVLAVLEFVRDGSSDLSFQELFFTLTVLQRLGEGFDTASASSHFLQAIVPQIHLLPVSKLATLLSICAHHRTPKTLELTELFLAEVFRRASKLMQEFSPKELCDIIFAVSSKIRPSNQDWCHQLESAALTAMRQYEPNSLCNLLVGFRKADYTTFSQAFLEKVCLVALAQAKKLEPSHICIFLRLSMENETIATQTKTTLIPALLDAALRHARDFKMRDLCDMLFVMGGLSQCVPPNWVQDFLRKAEFCERQGELLPLDIGMVAMHLSDLLGGFSDQEPTREQLYGLLANACLEHASSFTPKQVCQCLVGFAHAQQRNEDLLKLLCDRAVLLADQEEGGWRDPEHEDNKMTRSALKQLHYHHEKINKYLGHSAPSTPSSPSSPVQQRESFRMWLTQLCKIEGHERTRLRRNWVSRISKSSTRELGQTFKALPEFFRFTVNQSDPDGDCLLLDAMIKRAHALIGESSKGNVFEWVDLQRIMQGLASLLRHPAAKMCSSFSLSSSPSPPSGHYGELVCEQSSFFLSHLLNFILASPELPSKTDLNAPSLRITLQALVQFHLHYRTELSSNQRHLPVFLADRLCSRAMSLRALDFATHDFASCLYLLACLPVQERNGVVSLLNKAAVHIGRMAALDVAKTFWSVSTFLEGLPENETEPPLDTIFILTLLQERVLDLEDKLGVEELSLLSQALDRMQYKNQRLLDALESRCSILINSSFRQRPRQETLAVTINKLQELRSPKPA